MAGVDPAPLAQEVRDGRRAAVVDDRPRLVHQPVAELGDEGLDGELVDRGVERDARHHVAEGDHLAELRRLAGRSGRAGATAGARRGPRKVPLPLTGIGLAAHHADGRVGEVAAAERRTRRPRRSTSALTMTSTGERGRADEQVDGRRLALAARLLDEADARFAAGDAGDDVDRPVLAAAGHHDDFRDPLSPPAPAAGCCRGRARCWPPRCRPSRRRCTRRSVESLDLVAPRSALSPNDCPLCTSVSRVEAGSGSLPAGLRVLSLATPRRGLPRRPVAAARSPITRRAIWRTLCSTFPPLLGAVVHRRLRGPAAGTAAYRRRRAVPADGVCRRDRRNADSPSTHSCGMRRSSTLRPVFPRRTVGTS